MKFEKKWHQHKTTTMKLAEKTTMMKLVNNNNNEVGKKTIRKKN